jgi:hypothetical protein
MSNPWKHATYLILTTILALVLGFYIGVHRPQGDRSYLEFFPELGYSYNQVYLTADDFGPFYDALYHYTDGRVCVESYPQPCIIAFRGYAYAGHTEVVVVYYYGPVFVEKGQQID